MNRKLFNKHLKNYFETRKNKRRGKDSIIYELNWTSNLIKGIREREARTFKINENSVFLVPYPKWREIFATEFEGRRADHEICDRLKEYIELELTPRTFNNRKGKGSSSAVKLVIIDINDTVKLHGNAWIIKLDFKGFFPNARWDVAEENLFYIVDKYIKDIKEKEYLKFLIHQCIYCDPANNCVYKTPKELWSNISPDKSIFNKEYGVGAAIGRLIWQTSMGLYINEELKWLNENLKLKATCFVDDIVIVVEEQRKSFALSIIPELRRKIERKGCKFNDKKFYCQPYYNGLEFLGFHIKKNRIYLNNRTVTRAFYKILELNKILNKYENMSYFLSSINSYIGMLKNINGLKIIYRLLESLDGKWWKYCEFNIKRLCIQAKPEYSYKRRLNKKFKLKLKNL